nr:serine/threonine protein kinase [Oligoflexales bacterium]
MEKNLLLDNRYQLENRIGSGGMASVYMAMDLKLKRKVAVKILHEHMAKNPEIKKRFQLEAQAISAIEHPNIVKIYDYSGINSEHSWLVTEVISGQNLGEYLSLFPKSRLHPILASCIVREVSKALGAAHDKGIIHRDIKPENVMITETGVVRLMDFGIAKDLQQNSLTQTGTFIGSPGYMSVEQIKGKGVDYRSDIYSLSILFYELVTGVLPYKGSSS